VSKYIRICWFGALIAGCLAAAPVPLGNSLTTTERLDHQRENRALVDLLQNLHYSDQQFRDVDSSDMIDAYIAKLDPERLIFTEGDLKHWKLRFGRTLKAVYLLRGDEQPVYEIADRFRAAALDRCAWVEAKLAAGVDLTKGDAPLGRDLAPATDATELDQRWEKQLRATVLRHRILGRTAAEAAKVVREQYQDFRDEIERLNATRVREIFWEALLGLFDPHSGYFASDTADEFAVMMRGGVSGVGLSVARSHGRIKIVSLQPAGPADENGELEPQDELVALVDEQGKRTELAGLTASDVTTRLRGKPGTKLQVFYRRGDNGEVRNLTLVRRDLVLIQDRARGALATVATDAGKTTLGWIYLPDFYHDSQDGVTTSAAADVRELLTQLEAAGAQAFVLDLRGNPGGAIVEAVGLAGLFIPGGVVAITRGSDLKPKPQAVEKPVTATDKPLIVLISRHSASASELFAGAMHFHRRALIVGSERTFGKGTAQAYIDLNRLAFHPANAGRWGTLRVTSDKFYFPDGQSAQGTGAKSDFELPQPDVEDDFKFEEQLPHALRAEKLTDAPPPRATGHFATAEAAVVRDLAERSTARRSVNADFRVAADELAYAKHVHDAPDKTLNLEQAVALDQTLLVARENLRREVLGLVDSVDSTPVEIAAVREAKSRHEVLARARKPTAADARIGWADRATFRFDDAGTLREIPLPALPFRERAIEAQKLADVFNHASGQTITDATMAAVLRKLALLDTYSDAEIARCFTGEKPGDPSTWRGIEAVFHELAIGESTTFSRLKYDVTARETLRIAADWTQRIGANPNGESKK